MWLWRRFWSSGGHQSCSSSDDAAGQLTGLCLLIGHPSERGRWSSSVVFSNWSVHTWRLYSWKTLRTRWTFSWNLIQNSGFVISVLQEQGRDERVQVYGAAEARAPPSGGSAELQHRPKEKQINFITWNKLHFCHIYFRKNNPSFKNCPVFIIQSFI